MFLRKLKNSVHDFAQLFGIVDDSLVRLPDLTLYPAAPFFDTGRAHGRHDKPTKGDGKGKRSDTKRPGVMPGLVFYQLVFFQSFCLIVFFCSFSHDK